MSEIKLYTGHALKTVFLVVLMVCSALIWERLLNG